MATTGPEIKLMTLKQKNRSQHCFNEAFEKETLRVIPIFHPIQPRSSFSQLVEL